MIKIKAKSFDVNNSMPIRVITSNAPNRKKSKEEINKEACDVCDALLSVRNVSKITLDVRFYKNILMKIGN